MRKLNFVPLIAKQYTAYTAAITAIYSAGLDPHPQNAYVSSSTIQAFARTELGCNFSLEAIRRELVRLANRGRIATLKVQDYSRLNSGEPLYTTLERKDEVNTALAQDAQRLEARMTSDGDDFLAYLQNLKSNLERSGLDSLQTRKIPST